MTKFYKLIALILIIKSNSAFATTLNISDFQRLLSEQQKNELRFIKKYENSFFKSIAPFRDVRRFDVNNFEYIVHFDTKYNLSCALRNQETINFVAELDKGDMIQITARFYPEYFDHKGILLADCELSRVPKRK